MIRKRKQETILHTRRYKIHAEPEKYYHAKLLLYYTWNHENDIISTYTTYHNSYMSKQTIIHQNAKKFNEGCVAFDVDLQDWKTIYLSLHGGWLLQILHRMIAQQTSKVSTHYKIRTKKNKTPQLH